MGRLESAHRAVWRRWGRAVGREAEKGEGGWMDGWMDGRGGGHATTDGDGVRRARVPLFPPPSSSPLAPCPRPPPVGVSGGRPEDPRGWEAGRVAAEDGSVWPECERVCGEGG
jgi:hypothetical protein